MTYSSCYLIILEVLITYYYGNFIILGALFTCSSSTWLFQMINY